MSGRGAPIDAAAAAISALLADYAERIDAGDFAGVGALLGACRVTMADGTEVASGSDAITRLYELTTRRYPDGTPLTHHVITNLIVEPEPLDQDGDPASSRGGDESTGVVRRWRARSRFTVFQATDDLPLAPIVAGRYRDLVDELADGTWRFRERSMEPLLLGTLDQHLLIAL